MEDNAYLVQDILISKDMGKFQPVYEKDRIVGLFSSTTNQSVEIQTYYLDSNGLPHIFKPEAGVITKYVSSTLHIDLNMNLSYFLVVNDPKLHIPSAMTDIVLRQHAAMEPGPGIMSLSLKVLEMIDLVSSQTVILHDSPYGMKNLTVPRVHVKRTLSMIFHIVLRRALWPNQAVDLIGIDLTWRKYLFVKMLQ